MTLGIFSFNGLMSIPQQSSRDEALEEIYRVLRKGGFFIFTTHDRNKEAEFFDFRKREKETWSKKMEPTGPSTAFLSFESVVLS